MFHADLHIHSRFSRACSKNCDVPALAWWGARKGVSVIGTGDFAHPAWAAELAETLIPAEPGLLRLRPDLESRLRQSLPASCSGQVRFLLSTEISTIYKRDGATRKVHHLIYAPTFDAASRITTALARAGNLASDGRPILGLDSRDLLEITLNAGPGCYLVPAHIWTPWFAVLGSKSGFDSVAECYRDLADHIFAVETGLSSDPPMNWMCSGLDKYRLVSNSDAHSPPMIGREATTFSISMDYFAMTEALRTGAGLAGTVNFHPEGGRYHLDGHRKCGIRLEPSQSRIHDGDCPQCGKPLTIGVLHRVAELADRPAGRRPPGTAGYRNLVSLPEIVGELFGTGPKSKKVTAEVDRLVAALGPELHILCDADPAAVSQTGGSLLGEAVSRLRRGEVIKEAGYDGEYGTIRLFQSQELVRAEALFDLPSPADPPSSGTQAPAGPRDAGPDAPPGPGGTGSQRTRPRRRGAGDQGAPAVAGKEPGSLPDGLDPDQRAAAQAPGPLMIIAGPGTGKTRTLTHRIGYQLTQRMLPPESCLAVTFTRRAAEEMRDRLAVLIPRQAGRLTVTTFHGLGLMILREHAGRAGLTPGFSVADDKATLAVLTETAGSERAARLLLADPGRRPDVRKALAARDLVDLDGLIDLPVGVLRAEPATAAALAERWPLVSVDEYQDIDAGQYALLRLLTGTGGGLTVIGDPDQAIYGFRGADVGFFLRFGEDYPGATTVQLTRNYRSAPAIVTGALSAIAPATLVPGRVLQPAGPAGPPPPADGRAADGRAADGRAADGRAADQTEGDAAPATITFHEAADEHAEAAWIASAIDRLLGGASFHSLDSGRADGHVTPGLSLADIAVLYRTDAQASGLGQGLARAGLPFQKRSHDLLARRVGVPEIVREMTLDGSSWPGTGPGGHGLPTALAAGTSTPTAGTSAPWAGTSTPTAGTSQAVAGRLAAAVRTIAHRAGHASAAAVDVLTAGEVLAPLARRCGNDLERFLTEIALGAEIDALDPRADAITLLTMHAAKGLEYRVVFLAGCERGLVPLWLPGARSSTPDDACSGGPGDGRMGGPGMGGPGSGAPGDGAPGSGAPGSGAPGSGAPGDGRRGRPGDGRRGGPDPAEERRLLFVGMTRAQSHLFLTCAARRRWRGAVRDAGPSPFLAAIPASLLTRTAPARARRPTQRQLRLL